MDNHFGENCVVHQVIYGMETRYLGIGTLMTQAVPYLGNDLDGETYIGDSLSHKVRLVHRHGR